MSNRLLSILLFLCLLGGGALGVGVLLIGPDRVEQRSVDVFEDYQEMLAEQAAMRLWDSLSEIDVRLSTARDQARAQTEQGDTPRPVSSLLTQFSHHSDGERGITLAILDRRGQVLTAEPEPSDPVAEALSTIDLSEAVSIDEELTVDNWNLLDQGLAVVAIELDSQHLLAASIDFHRLAGRIFEQVTGAGYDRAVLLDSDGDVVYVQSSTTDSRQHQWISGRAQVPQTGLSVEVAAPRSVIAPDVRSLVRSVVFASFLVLGLFGVSMVLFIVIARRGQRQRLTQVRLLAHQDKLATLGMMAASTAHEIRNAISVATLQLEVASSRADEEMSRHIDKAFDAVERLAKLAESLSRYGGKGEGESEYFDLSAAVDEALSVVQPKMGGDIILQLDTVEGLIVRGSRAAIVQVIVNLLFNAFDALGEGGDSATVGVRARRDGDGAILSVIDSGEGIDPGLLDKIFEPFYSTKSGAETTGGTGIGLWLCSQIVEQHGGSIHAENADAGGARFVVCLPLSQPDTDTDESPIS